MFNHLSKVSIVKVDDEKVDKAVRKAVEMVGGFKNLINEKRSVLIKPNLVWPEKSGTGITTDSRVIEAVTKLVLEYYPKRVVIGEGCGLGYFVREARERDTMINFRVSGTMDVAERLGVDLIDLNKDDKVEVKVPNAFVMKKFRVAKTALDADVRISVPVLKTHSQSTITCSLKNMKGALPGVEKRLTHKLGLERGIVDLNMVIKPHFALVDAIRGMQGIWRHPQDTVKMDLILAGSDPVAVDSVCSRLMGFDPSKILYLKLAQEANLGVSDTLKIKVVGEKLENVTRKFLTYFEVIRSRYPSISVIESKACTGCIGEIRNMVGFLENSGLMSQLNDLKVITGSPEVIPEEGEKIIVGKCAEKYKDLGFFVPGCPPHGREIALAVCRKFNLDEQVLLETIKQVE